MNFLETFKQTFAIIASPAASWEKLSVEIGDTTKKDSLYFYSLLGVNVVIAFIGALFFSDTTLVAAILKAIIWGIALYGGYWAVYYVLFEILFKKHHIELVKHKAIRLIFYSFALTLSIHIITSLFPGLFFLKVALIYTLYIVWEGVGKMIPTLDENERSNFVLLLSCSVILLPIIIYQFLILAVPAAR